MKTTSSVALAAALLVLTACGSEDHVCALVFSPTGISVDVAAPDASRVASASLRVCWDGTCRTKELGFRPSSTTVPLGCDVDGPGSVCEASASPDGGQHGFAAITDLPESPVQVTLTLRDRDRRAFVDQELLVTPKATRADGPGCGPQGVQAALTVTNGRLAAR
ncbi:hypothetical protein [Actinomadura montaniterrae]|uniref:Uncharacterized protein n=1 Tax=Actinomadura montaniterrae TaxID=1803903 RepID=A0A6L3VZK3_9ACTN|nr:hypothetical protein [Actinomadura montaniterrae]KAB2388021.1 hypothetical protein F9B16_05490 [Actinomadura montaniterrae]